MSLDSLLNKYESKSGGLDGLLAKYEGKKKSSTPSKSSVPSKPIPGLGWQADVAPVTRQATGQTRVEGQPAPVYKQSQNKPDPKTVQPAPKPNEGMTPARYAGNVAKSVGNVAAGVVESSVKQIATALAALTGQYGAWERDPEMRDRARRWAAQYGPAAQRVVEAGIPMTPDEILKVVPDLAKSTYQGVATLPEQLKTGNIAPALNSALILAPVVAHGVGMLKGKAAPVVPKRTPAVEPVPARPRTLGEPPWTRPQPPVMENVTEAARPVETPVPTRTTTPEPTVREPNTETTARPRIKRIFDSFKHNDAPYFIEEGMFTDRKVWSPDAYTEDYMTRSNESNRLLRWVVQLEDGQVMSMDGYMRQYFPDQWKARRASLSGKKAALNLWNSLSKEEQQAMLDDIDWYKLAEGLPDKNSSLHQIEKVLRDSGSILPDVTSEWQGRIDDVFSRKSRIATRAEYGDAVANHANDIFNRRTRTLNGPNEKAISNSYLAVNDEGDVVRVFADRPADVRFYERLGFRPLNDTAKPTPPTMAPEAPTMPEKPPVAPVEGAGTAEVVVETPSSGYNPVVRMKTKDIGVDPTTFQFRMERNPELENVKRWDPDLAGVVLVWKDPKTGKTWVVNGHHRLNLANRLGVQDVDVRYINAQTAAEARVKGALANIAEGRATAADAAKLFRDTGLTPDDLTANGVSLTGKTASDGMALSRLNDNLFNAVIQGKLTTDRGVAIGRRVTDSAAQDALYTLLRKRGGKPLSAIELEELTRRVLSADTTTAKQVDLFGEAQLVKNLAVEEAQLSGYIREQLRKDKTLFGRLSSDAIAKELERGQNIIAPGENARIAAESAIIDEVYGKLSDKTGPVSDILRQGAQRLAAKENPNAVKAQIYRQVRDEVSAFIEGTKSGRSGSAEVVGRTEPTPTQAPAVTPPPKPDLPRVETDRPAPSVTQGATTPTPPAPPAYEVKRNAARAKIAEIAAKRGKFDVTGERGSAPLEPVDPELLAAYRDIALSYIEEGAVKFADWSKRMIEEAKQYGHDIKPHLAGLWKEIGGEKPVEAGGKRTKYAGSVNLDKWDTVDDIKQWARDTYDANQPTIDEQRRGVRTHEQTQEAADSLAMTAEAARTIKKGTALNAEQNLALAEETIAAADKVKKASSRLQRIRDGIEQGNIEVAEAELLKAQADADLLFKVLNGTATEAGRALEIHKKIRKAYEHVVSKPVDVFEMTGTPPPAIEVKLPRNFGANNRLFTRSKFEAANVRLAQKMQRMNAGVPIDMIPDLVEIGGYYVEGAFKEFTDWAPRFAREMKDRHGLDLGETDLKTVWEAIRTESETLAERWQNRPGAKTLKSQALRRLEKYVGGKENVTSDMLDELSKIDDDDMNGLVNYLAKRHKVTVGQTALDILNFSRTTLTAGDLSATLRQGAVLGAGHPKSFVRALKAYGTVLKNDAGFNKLMADIRNHPQYEALENAGVFLGEIDGGLSAAEEAFMSKFAQKIPGVRFSARAYTGFLNALRADVFYRYADALGDGMTAEQAKALADVINAGSGRGRLGMLENSGHALSTALFSPRFLTSRFQVLYDPFVKSGPARTAALKNLLGFSVAVGSTLWLLKQSGAQVETDPRSSDFGKARWGKFRLDLTAGYAPLIRYAYQFAVNERKSTETGRVRTLNRAATLGRFARSKASPSVGLAADLLTGKTYTGEDTLDRFKHPGKLIAESFLPMNLQDFYDGLKQQGLLTGLAAGALSTLGANAQTYDRSPLQKFWDAGDAKVPKHLMGLWSQYKELPARDQTAFVTRWPELKTYRNIEKAERLRLRKANPDLDAELVAKYGYSPVTKQGRDALTRLRQSQGLPQQTGKSGKSSSTGAMNYAP